MAGQQNSVDPWEPVRSVIRENRQQAGCLLPILHGIQGALGLVFVHPACRVALLALPILLAACGEEAISGVALRHPNGLVALRPGGFRHEVTDAGFDFTEAGALRSPRAITVALADTDPLDGGGRQETADGSPARVRITELGTGSGGVEYRFLAVKPDGDTFVVITAWAQTEASKPSFGIARAVLGSARVVR